MIGQVSVMVLILFCYWLRAKRHPMQAGRPVTDRFSVTVLVSKARLLERLGKVEAAATNPGYQCQQIIKKICYLCTLLFLRCSIFIQATRLVDSVPCFVTHLL